MEGDGVERRSWGGLATVPHGRALAPYKAISGGT